jgi:hypothetical protein
MRGRAFGFRSRFAVFGRAKPRFEAGEPVREILRFDRVA